jgi:CheY-like chemotaxis protein
MTDMLELPKANRILIVEDVKDNYILLKAYLKRYKVDVVHVSSVNEFWNYFNSNPEIDVLLMDIRLPDGNGISVTKELREKGVSIPIIAQTAYADSHDKFMCIESGCSDYIAKPILKTNFINKISKFVKLVPKD